MRIRGKVRSFPLEKVRMATPDEMLGSRFIVSMLDQMADEIRMGRLQLEEPQPDPLPAGQRQRQTRAIMEEEEKSDEEMQPQQAQADPYQRSDGDRARQLRRMELLNDVPESVRSSLSSGSSGPALVRQLQPVERNQMLLEDDDEDDLMGTQDDGIEPSGMQFAQKKQPFEDFSKKKPKPFT